MGSLVDFLCSETCAGRAPGTAESAAARERIVAELQDAGAEPASEEGYLQRVPGCGTNVLARLPGSGALSGRTLLVAAHYDHLGRVAPNEVYWGADDNAAAVAILVELARAVRPSAADGRQVLLVSFDGEEPPHFLSETMGSMYYAEQPVVPLEQTDTMICLDLVGHALGPPHLPEAIRQTVFVLGAELSEGTPALVDAAAARARGVFPRRLGLDVVPPLSDYDAFVRKHVPVLFLTCGRWEHYHSTTDTPDRLDLDKMEATTDFLVDLLEELAIRPDVPVLFRPDGRDDEAQVATLVTMATVLETFVPDIVGFLPILDDLAKAAARGPLDPHRREQVQSLCRALELQLGATR